MAPLTREQIAVVRADLSKLAEKHGFSSAYMVLEHRKDDGKHSDHCLVVCALVEPHKPTQFMAELAEQTFDFVESIACLKVDIHGN